MNISKTILIAAISGIAGCLIGALAVSRYWARLTTELVSSGNGAEAAQLVHNLRLLRQGKTQEAINLMEMELDGNILTLGYQGKGMGSKTKGSENLLQNVAAYRKESPYVTAAPELKSKIDQALSASNQ
jgi:hypothetical protein